MRTKVINLYSFDELSEEAKQKVISELWDINVNFNWWQFTYEDAENVGIEIQEFDIDKRYCKLICDDDCIEVAQNIVKNWGNACSGYSLSEKFIEDFKTVSEDDLSDLEYQYTKELSKIYLNILAKEYDYLTSKDAIVETIQANEYEFTEDGESV